MTPLHSTTAPALPLLASSVLLIVGLKRRLGSFLVLLIIFQTKTGQNSVLATPKSSHSDIDWALLVHNFCDCYYCTHLKSWRTRHGAYNSWLSIPSCLFTQHEWRQIHHFLKAKHRTCTTGRSN